MSECAEEGGHPEIPVRLYVTVIFIAVFSLSFIVGVAQKGWLHYELVTSEMMTGSYTVSRLTLGAYRILVTLYSFGYWMWSVHHAEESGKRVLWDMRFYSAWNYTTLCVVFFLLSLQHVFTYVPNWVTKVTWTLFQVELAQAVFLDIVIWSILWPHMADYSMPFFFSMLNGHAFNAVFLFGDVFLGKLQMVPAHMGWTFVYATVYVIVVWINYSLTTDCMPYSFLDVGPQLAPVWYVGLVIFLAVIFSAVSGLVACRERWHTGVWPTQTTSEYTPLN
eukprot:m.56706 g.56706  ORF g.56706 m.56706 type:complete len:277 (-) comp9317_c0_seq1:2365-3195(-)